MGKKNKNNASGAEDIAMTTRKDKKRKHSNTDGTSTDINEPVHEKRNKKNKNNVVANDAKQDPDVSKQTNKIDKHLVTDNADVNIVSESKKVKRKKRDKNVDAANETMPKNKKIIFNDDGQGEDTQKFKDGNVSSKKQFLSGEEAAVTEEEIDKFCDELDEEDNVHFDNWVKLIEERLHPSKKNKTT